jgi:hypothetical protein
MAWLAGSTVLVISQFHVLVYDVSASFVTIGA